MRLINSRINEELAELTGFIQKMFPGVSGISFVCHIDVEGEVDLAELQKLSPKLVSIPSGHTPVYRPDDAAGDATM